MFCGIAVCRLSVRPFVTLMDCDRTGWNSLKIISRLDSLERSLSAMQTEHHGSINIT